MIWYLSMILLIPAVIFCSWAQAKVKSNYNKYSKVMNKQGITGAQAARRMLDANGLQGIQVLDVRGQLTDNFNPQNNTVNLSSGVYDAPTVAALGIACHECGHAIQHAVGYSPLRIRTAIVPVTRIGTTLAIPVFLIGLLMSMPGLETAGVLLFSLAVIFQAVTLPVEFDASRRALIQLKELEIVTDDEEYEGTRKVLSAAALTYVGALLMQLLQLARLILLSRARR
ncbi:MAG: zinc metallopeptidase [Firmicutes bacterium]|nr:zinc metallopeptidase [Bacillota bacterium]MBR6503469.1 zinc metallopeptidase [Bacillota bacterium]